MNIKLSYLQGYQYSIPSNKRELLADFYLCSFIKTAPVKKNNTNFQLFRDQENISELINEISNTLLPYIKSYMLDIVYKSCASEIYHSAAKILSFKNENYDHQLFEKYLYIKHENRQETYDKISYRERLVRLLKIKKDIFIKFCYDMFSNAEWVSQYGGEKWAKIAESWILLNNAKSLNEIIIYIDHIIDLEHNTGSIFTKFKEFNIHDSMDWIKSFLDMKSNIDIYVLLNYSSTTMKKIAPYILHSYGYGSLEEATNEFQKHNSIIRCIESFPFIFLKNLVDNLTVIKNNSFYTKMIEERLKDVFINKAKVLTDENNFYIIISKIIGIKLFIEMVISSLKNKNGYADFYQMIYSFISPFKDEISPENLDTIFSEILQDKSSIKELISFVKIFGEDKIKLLCQKYKQNIIFLSLKENQSDSENILKQFLPNITNKTIENEYDDLILQLIKDINVAHVVSKLIEIKNRFPSFYEKFIDRISNIIIDKIIYLEQLIIPFQIKIMDERLTLKIVKNYKYITKIIDIINNLLYNNSLSHITFTRQATIRNLLFSLDEKTLDLILLNESFIHQMCEQVVDFRNSYNVIQGIFETTIAKFQDKLANKITSTLLEKCKKDDFDSFFRMFHNDNEFFANKLMEDKRSVYEILLHVSHSNKITDFINKCPPNVLSYIQKEFLVFYKKIFYNEDIPDKKSLDFSNYMKSLENTQQIRNDINNKEASWYTKYNKGLII